MAMNRVQFQPGLSMAEFTGLYGTQELCEAAVRSWRWPEGFVCPGCGTTDHSEFRRGSLLYFQCCSCRHQCSLICGTIFASTKLPLTRWFLAMHLLTQAKNNVAALELMRHLGVSYPTAWLIKHKIMEVMRQREERRYLTGRVEIRRLPRRRTAWRQAGSRVGEQGVVCRRRANHRVRRARLRLLLAAPVHQGVVARLRRQVAGRTATLVSDGLGCFKAVQGTGILHEPHVTGGGANSVKRPEFAAVNTILGNLKTALAGTYHSFNIAKYAHRYLAQVQYRFNRRLNLRSILGRLAGAACHTSPCPLRVAQCAEHS